MSTEAKNPEQTQQMVSVFCVSLEKLKSNFLKKEKRLGELHQEFDWINDLDVLHHVALSLCFEPDFNSGESRIEGTLRDNLGDIAQRLVENLDPERIPDNRTTLVFGDNGKSVCYWSRGVARLWKEWAENGQGEIPEFLCDLKSKSRIPAAIRLPANCKFIPVGNGSRELIETTEDSDQIVKPTWVEDFLRLLPDDEVAETNLNDNLGEPNDVLYSGIISVAPGSYGRETKDNDGLVKSPFGGNNPDVQSGKVGMIETAEAVGKPEYGSLIPPFEGEEIDANELKSGFNEGEMALDLRSTPYVSGVSLDQLQSSGAHRIDGLLYDIDTYSNPDSKVKSFGILSQENMDFVKLCALNFILDKLSPKDRRELKKETVELIARVARGLMEDSDNCGSIVIFIDNKNDSTCRLTAYEGREVYQRWLNILKYFNSDLSDMIAGRSEIGSLYQGLHFDGIDELQVNQAINSVIMEPVHAEPVRRKHRKFGLFLKKR